MAFNPDEPTATSSDFLLPVLVDGSPKFLGLSSGKYYDYGMVVMTGKEVTVNDVFAKLLDSGRKIESVDQTLEYITKYLEFLKSFKIGNVIRIKDDSSSGIGFALEKTELKPTVKKKGIP